MPLCPYLLPALVIGDEPRLLAGSYVPLVDGPRMKRVDADAEVNRRQNLAARIRPNAIFFAGMDQAARLQMKIGLPEKRCFDVSNVGDLRRLNHGIQMRPRKVLTWGSSHIGVGLHRALREKRQIEFSEADSPPTDIVKKSDQLVACETGWPGFWARSTRLN